MAIARWVALVTTVAAACGGGGPPKLAAPKQQPDIDPAQAETDAKGLVTEVYQSIGHGDTDSLMTLLSDQLVVFGPRRGDALATRQDAIVALHALVDADHKRPLKSGQLAIVPGPGGHSAVAFDEIESGGKTLAVLALLTNSDDIWLVQTASLAEPPAAAVIAKELAQNAIVPPAMAGPAKVDDYAKPVVDQWKKELAAQDAWGAALAGDDDGLYVGPGQGEVVRGKKDLKALWKKRAAASTREVVAGEVTAGSTPDGRMAWVSAPVARAMGSEATLPVRMFAVYERHGDAWRLCALQESVAIDAPGAGAKYKAMVPAAPPVAPPPPPPQQEKKIKKPPADDGGGDAKTASDDAPPPPKKKAAKKTVKKPPANDDATTASDDPPPPPKKKAKAKKPPPKDDDDTATASDDPPPKKKPAAKKKAKPPPKDDDDSVTITSGDDDPPKKKPKKKAKPPPKDDDDDGN